jgi:2-phosphosulfolactate phosphatase
MLSINTCLSTDFVKYQNNIENKVVVIIDILRATTCMITAFMEGASHIRAFNDPDSCFQMRKDKYLVAGERDGEKLEGFDLGNSPFDYINLGVKDQKIAITTTNGTKALLASESAVKVVICSFLNISATCTDLIKENKDVLIFCAGWKGLVNTEDTLCAGMIISKIKDFGFELNDDASVLAFDFYKQNSSNILEVLKSSAHAKRLKKFVSPEKDIEYAAQLDVTSIIPIFEKDLILDQDFT